MTSHINFDQLPDAALVREKHLICILPFSNATLWRRVKSGSFPQPTRLSEGRVTAWRVGDVRKWLADQVKAVAA